MRIPSGSHVTLFIVKSDITKSYNFGKWINLTLDHLLTLYCKLKGLITACAAT